MSEKILSPLAMVRQDIYKLKPKFEVAIGTNSKLGISFEREASFAVQILANNEGTLKAARSAPESVQSAVMNIANMGLSLNPAQNHAYLVPRSGKVILDISYRGLLHLATRDGGIKFATVEVVKEGDTFVYNGKDIKPEHPHNPFEEGRGDKKTIGVYCIAHLPSGDIIVDVMARDEIEKARNCSTMKSGGVWLKWYDDMCKKTIVKKASKTWPACPTLANAAHYLNEEADEGLEVVKTNAEIASDALAGKIVEGEC